MNGIFNKKLINGALSLTVSAFFVKLVGVFYKIPLLYIIGEEGMGYFNTAYTIYGFFYILCSAGIPKAITCIIISHKQDASQLGEYKLYKSALKLLSIFALGVSLLYLFLTPVISSLIGNNGALLTMIAISPTIFFVTVSGVIRGYLCSERRMLPVAVAQVIEALFKLVLGLILATLGMKLSFSLRAVSALSVMGITIGSVASTILLYIWAETVEKDKKAGQSCLKTKDLAGKIFKIALPITLGTSVLNIGNIFDVSIIIRGLLGSGMSIEEANAVYGNYSTLAIPMLNLVISLVTPLTVTLLPELISVSKIDNRLFQERLNRAVLITSIIVAPCCSVIAIYSFDLLDVLFSSAQAASGYNMLASLSLGIYLLSLLNVYNTALEAKGKFYSPIICLSFVTLSKIAISYILSAHTSLGILGVPLGTTLSYSVGLIISLVILKFNGVKYRISYALIPLMLSILSYLIPYIFFYINGLIFGGFLEFFFILLISTVGYFILMSVYLLCFSSKSSINTKLNPA